MREIMTIPVDDLQEKRAKGTADVCFISKVLDDYESMQDRDPEFEEDIKILGVVTFSAGYDTTASAVLTFFLMMTLHPEVVEKAQAEIDEVTGSHRLPTLDDRPNMPYVECILKEVYRIYAPAPFGLPRQSKEMDHYGDWTIPAGSMVISNLWGMLHDEKQYPDPRAFIPERFLDLPEASKGKLEPDSLDPKEIIFGFGRRICPGRFFADTSVWLAVANVLAAFRIGPYIDPSSGKEIRPEVAYLPGFTSIPKDFKCSITPRSTKHAQLIQKEINEQE